LTGQYIGRAASIGKPLFAAMRWLMMVFLVSLGVLLFAAAGVAHHIWLQRAKLRRKPPAGAGPALDPARDPAEETDQELEP